jgi:hypothetical protein
VDRRMSDTPGLATVVLDILARTDMSTKLSAEPPDNLALLDSECARPRTRRSADAGGMQRNQVVALEPGRAASFRVLQIQTCTSPPPPRSRFSSLELREGAHRPQCAPIPLQ